MSFGNSIWIDKDTTVPGIDKVHAVLKADYERTGKKRFFTYTKLSRLTNINRLCIRHIVMVGAFCREDRIFKIRAKKWILKVKNPETGRNRVKVNMGVSII